MSFQEQSDRQNAASATTYPLHVCELVVEFGALGTAHFLRHILVGLVDLLFEAGERHLGV